jgi:hypothetical protein
LYGDYEDYARFVPDRDTLGTAPDSADDDLLHSLHGIEKITQAPASGTEQASGFARLVDRCTGAAVG